MPRSVPRCFVYDMLDCTKSVFTPCVLNSLLSHVLAKNPRSSSRFSVSIMYAPDNGVFINFIVWLLLELLLQIFLPICVPPASVPLLLFLYSTVKSKRNPGGSWQFFPVHIWVFVRPAKSAFACMDWHRRYNR